MLRPIAVSAIHAILVLTVYAQAPSRADSTLEGAKNEEEARNALYQRFLETRETDQPAAYGFAKEALRKYSQDTEQAKYLKRWVEIYDLNLRRRRQVHVVELLEQSKLEQGFALGREILASEPYDFNTLINLVNGGLLALQYRKSSLVIEASGYARKALELVESGKVTVKDRDTTLGWLNRSLGLFFLISAPAEAADFLYKALQVDALKYDAALYGFLADAILGARYLPLLREYNSTYPTPQQKRSAGGRALRAKINRAADLAIDALARAVALAPSSEPQRVRWMEYLANAYRARNSGYLTGLEEFINSRLQKPLPR